MKFFFKRCKMGFEVLTVWQQVLKMFTAQFRWYIFSPLTNTKFRMKFNVMEDRV